MQIECPPFTLLREDGRIDLSLYGKLIESFRCKVMERVFTCLHDDRIRTNTDVNCHGFVFHAIFGGKPAPLHPQYRIGTPMDMVDAQKKFGLPFRIQFFTAIEIIHSALAIGWDDEEPVIADKWGSGPINIRHMCHSREKYPHKGVYCSIAL